MTTTPGAAGIGQDCAASSADDAAVPLAGDQVIDTSATGGPRLARSSARAVWDGLLAALGVLLGLAPHVLHHVGFLAGTALVAGSGGTALFGAVGFIASIPMLLKLRRRFGTWRAPAIGLAVFAAMFALSAFVLGPAFSDAASNEPTAPAVEQPGEEHDSHHS